jgi:hypothetical protein
LALPLKPTKGPASSWALVKVVSKTGLSFNEPLLGSEPPQAAKSAATLMSERLSLKDAMLESPVNS